MTARALQLAAGVAAAALFLLLPAPAGMSPEAQAVAATAILMAVWWMTQAIPLAATSLVPLVAFPLLGVMSMAKATAPYAHHLIFLFMGGFMIAAAIEKVQLHRRFALWTILLFGAQPRGVIAGFMAATAFISMWISNTATVMMMLPISTATIAALARKDGPPSTSTPFDKALLLGITYAASIGGVATLIGSPPNAIVAGVLDSTLGQPVTFGQWMAVGLPLALLLLPVTWAYLVFVAQRVPQESAGHRSFFRQMLREMGPMRTAEKRVLCVFILVGICWITRGFLEWEALRFVNDATVAIAGALSLFIIPAGDGSPVLDWKSAERIPWGILLLFGGGLSLAAAVDASGLAQWIGNEVTTLHALPYFVFVLCLAGTITFLTEFTSNTAIAAVFAPIVAGICVSTGLPTFGLLFTVAVAAAFAFMLPVATPPNAIVFSSGHLSVRDMATTGFAMNLLSALLLAITVALVLPAFGL